MPTYDYRCSEGHEKQIEESMFSEVEVICKCGEKMWRKPQMPAVNWGGLKPSDLENNRSPLVQSMIDNEDRNRAKYIEKKEKRNDRHN